MNDLEIVEKIFKTGIDIHQLILNSGYEDSDILDFIIFIMSWYKFNSSDFYDKILDFINKVFNYIEPIFQNMNK